MGGGKCGATGNGRQSRLPFYGLISDLSRCLRQRAVRVSDFFWAAWRRSGDKSRRGCVGGRWSRLQLWSSQTWGCCAQQQCTAAEQSAANRRNNSYPIHTLYAPCCTLHPCFRFGARRLSSPRRGENCSRARHRLQSWDYIGPRSFPIRGRDHRQEAILYIS